MLYLKRILSLILMVVLAWINNIILKQITNKLSVQVIVFCVINIVIVLLMVYSYNISKSITKNILIMLVEFIILAILIIIAFLPQIDGMIGNVLMARFKLTMEDIGFIHMMQFILGSFIISFVNIIRSVNIKRGNVISSIRYMG